MRFVGLWLLQTQNTCHSLLHAVSWVSKPTVGKLSGYVAHAQCAAPYTLGTLQSLWSHSISPALLQAAMLLSNPSMAPPPRHVTPMLSRMSTCSFSSSDTEVRH